MKKSLLLIAATLFFLSSSLSAEPPSSLRPGREVSLPPDQVKDTFFAYFLGIIKEGIEVDIDNAAMRDILVEFKSPLDLPFDQIDRVTQHEAPLTGERTIGLDFYHDILIPIPFSLLFYHPGSIAADHGLSFQVLRSTYDDPGDPEADTPVYDLLLISGSIFVDIDDWLEVLFGAYLEDTRINHVVFFQWNGDWMAMLEGSGGRSGRELRAYFDLAKNRIMFPVPLSLDRMGKALVP